jgi:glycosyltransferase involved in cell wall biosynthesis
MKITFVICSYNSKSNYLIKVLQGIKKQNIKKSDYELILVDNGNNLYGKNILQFVKKLNGKVIKESKVGLTNARVRGIKKAKGKIIIFVDDDNVLCSKYTQNAISHFKRNPNLGIVGGQYFGVFQKKVPTYAKPFLGLVCVGSPLKKDQWSNQPESIPPIAGAGMVVRRDVARKYVMEIRKSLLRINLDRSGKDLLSGGDTDLCICCAKYGYGVGKFKDLYLKHLIPEERLKKPYLLNLNKAMVLSNLLIKKIHRMPICIKPFSLIFNYFKSFTKKPFDGQMIRAGIHGQVKFILNHGLSN